MSFGMSMSKSGISLDNYTMIYESVYTQNAYREAKRMTRMCVTDKSRNDYDGGKRHKPAVVGVACEVVACRCNKAVDVQRAARDAAIKVTACGGKGAVQRTKTRSKRRACGVAKVKWSESPPSKQSKATRDKGTKSETKRRLCHVTYTLNNGIN